MIGEIITVEAKNLVWDESRRTIKGKIEGKDFVVPSSELMLQKIKCDKQDFTREIRQILKNGFTGVVQAVKNDTIVISRKEWQKQNYEQIQVGKIYEGEIVAVLPNAIFVDVNGLKVRVHAAECSRAKMYNLLNFFKPGDTTNVEITEKVQGYPYYISGSRRYAYPTITEETNKYEVGTCIIVRTCERMSNGGYWVEVTPGILGMLNEGEVLLKKINKGTLVKVQITGIDISAIKCRLVSDKGYEKRSK